MTTIELTDARLEPVTLGVERRITLGSGQKAPGELQDRISLGRPTCVPLDPSTVDADAESFLKGKPDSTFWLLGLRCSFRFIDDEPMETAWLEVRLRTVGAEGAAGPVAWSMEPLKLEDPVQISRVAKLDGSLKLSSPLVPLEVGASTGGEETTEFEMGMPYVEAHREGTSRPSWIFTRTEVTEIRGAHRLRTVVEVPPGATGQAEISAGATLKLKLLGVIPYRARLDELPEQQSVSLGG